MGNQKITPTNFIATVYGNLTPLNNSAFSKARLKIFYKGLNRNGSYITDEVAEKLLATLPGTPIVGYFDGDNDDFLGHVSPEQNKPYGFVPQDMNFKWEMSLDPDGVYRTYACTDIVLWTGRYPIASRIVGKSHSMELNPNTVEGEWVDDGDDFYYQFSNAEFFGLCILGDEYEPCFEGSSFYELHSNKEEENSISNELQEMFSLYKRELGIADENQTGGQEMEEENKDSVVEEVVVEEEVVVNNELDQEEKVSDEKDDKEVKEEESSEVEENNEEENNDEEEKEEEKPETEEVSEEEDKKDEEEEQEEVSEEEETKEVAEEASEEPESEEPDLNSQLAEKDAEIASLKAQLAELNSYKAQKVHEEKEQVIETYSNKLSEEEVENFKSKIDEFESAIELKKEIALCILDKEIQEAEESSNFSYVKSHKEELKGAEAIVARYAKK